MTTDVREARKDQLFDSCKAGQGMTALELVRSVGLKKTPYALQLIAELVHEGYLYKVVVKAQNGAEMFVYFCADS